MEQPGTPHHRQILLVEDNPLDARATMKALAELAAPHAIEHLADGSEAMARLTLSSHDGSPPHLVILDLNASGFRGFDILEAMKVSEDLAPIPVVVLSTSDHPKDVGTAQRLGASAYFTKPASFDGWHEIITRLDLILDDVSPRSPEAEVTP